jgi:hypothetical protein
MEMSLFREQDFFSFSFSSIVLWSFPHYDHFRMTSALLPCNIKSHPVITITVTKHDPSLGTAQHKIVARLNLSISIHAHADMSISVVSYGTKRAYSIRFHAPYVHCSLPSVWLNLEAYIQINTVVAASFQDRSSSSSSSQLRCSDFPLAMERLFSPCTRLRDRFENPPEGLQELNLDVSTAEFFGAERAFTYADLYAVLGNGKTAAWLTPHAAVARRNGRVVQSWSQRHGWCRFRFDADGDEIVAFASSLEHALEMNDIVLRLLAASVVHSLVLVNWNSAYTNARLISAPSLAFLMEQCLSLNVLTLKEMTLDEDHCRVLGAYSRPGLEIELKYCRIAGTAATVLAQVLGCNKGPTRLNDCDIDNVVLADGLRGNSRLMTVEPCLSHNLEVSNRELLAIAGALRENKGLVELSCYGYSSMKDETWSFLCDSLKTHPALEVLGLSGARPMAPDMMTFRIQALLEMIKLNTTIHTIHMHLCFGEHEMYRGSIIPYLEMNRFRPRLLAIQKARPIVYRVKVLGRALLATRTNANTFWMLLSGNAEVAFPSRSATITAAANLPTPNTTAATFTGQTAAVAASVMIALTSTAPGSVPTSTATDAATMSSALAFDASAPVTIVAVVAPIVAAAAAAAAAAANVTTPSAGQKRKARPSSNQGFINAIAVQCGAQALDVGTLGYAESNHDDTHYTKAYEPML